MSSEGDAFVFGVMCGAVLTILLCTIVHTNSMKDFKDEAIELNYAEFDNKTGVWQWKSEIKPKEQK